MIHRYALGLGSNRVSRHGPPARTVAAAVRALVAAGITVEARSPVIETVAVGPGARRYANAALLVRTDLAPSALLNLVKGIERRFGRRAARRWGDRVLDIDLLLWSAGRWRSRQTGGLTIPHGALAARDFVLQPLAAIAPQWRVPPGGLTVRQLRHRLGRLTPLPTPHRSRPTGP